MKNQKVSVDSWEMLKTSVLYFILVFGGWFVVRLFASAFRIPGRMREQHAMLQNSLEMLKERYPDLEGEMKKLEEEMNAESSGDGPSNEEKPVDEKKSD